MERRRAVITGAGICSALGNTRQELYEALRANRSAIRYMPEWEGFFGKPNIPAAPVSLDQAMVRKIDRHIRRTMGNASLFAALAALSAMQESGLETETLGNGRCGCAVSSTIGSSSSILESTQAHPEGRQNELSACQFFRCMSHTSSFNVANLLGLRGVQLSPCAACASSVQSLGTSLEQIQLGRQDVMFAGGSDEVTHVVSGSFQQVFALAEADGIPAEEMSRPFDQERIGLVCGEGAGIFVVEELQHALSRGAHILAEIKGYATNCTGWHASKSDPGQIRRCMELALQDAAMSPSDIDAISTHGTATSNGDAAEAQAIRELFGDKTPANSLKGSIGHTLGASGTMEAAVFLESMIRNELLPTRNLTRIADECAGVDFVHGAPRPAKVRNFLKNSIALGGVNTSIIIGEYQP